MEMQNKFSHQDIEKRIHEKRNHHHVSPFVRDNSESDECFSISLPPPNVTGTLHMGHALNDTLQDILVRWKRMKGVNTLWQPGLDHAGIATQMVVERMLKTQHSISRQDITREEFLEYSWQWKHKSGDTIIEQLKRLGASCDWDRTRFTLDDDYCHAVRFAFVKLYKDGLIFQDFRLVNWDPYFETAISDLEVVTKPCKGKLWYFKYLVEGNVNPTQHITIATTRPETMLGDTGIAVHPDDERYKNMIGKNAIIPIVGRKIPIVADDTVDMELGSGAVKITPAHDYNDFRIGQKHGLDCINIFDTKACIALKENSDFSEKLPEDPEHRRNLIDTFDSLDRFDARERIINMVEELGLLEKVEDHEHNVPYGDRSGTIIEPFLTKQWFLDAAKLADAAIKAVDDGKIQFYPANWANTYFQWLRNIEPWCISRQLWWGHRIPLWYGPDGQIFCEETEDDLMIQVTKHYGEVTKVYQDDDVLDTWFSSALWPFATLGWPNESSPEIERFFPNSTLITGFDIIFFWVARMVMFSMYFMKDSQGNGMVPFHKVYIHALVRDEKGMKMSKSLGNVIDPLQLIDTYGADAVRFTLASMAAMGRDVRLSEKRINGYRNFCTKIWNVARFSIQHIPQSNTNKHINATLHINRWIINETVCATDYIDHSLENFKFNDAANRAYSYVWNMFCDWYLEFTKSVFQHGSDEEKEETRLTMWWCLHRILHLLHPFMPFITEELMDILSNKYDSFHQCSYITFEDTSSFKEDVLIITRCINLIETIRSTRVMLNIPAALNIQVSFVMDNPDNITYLITMRSIIERLSKVTYKDNNNFGDIEEQDCQAISIPIQGGITYMHIGSQIDIIAERTRLQNRHTEILSNAKNLSNRLNNPGFLAKAPKEVLAETRGNLAKLEEECRQCEMALNSLLGLSI